MDCYLLGTKYYSCEDDAIIKELNQHYRFLRCGVVYFNFIS
jgi:hypothetical protein